ncbi:MAG: DUF550 domain-containing protein [Agriterribacter sp.]
MRENQFYDVISWQKRTFPGTTALSKLTHLSQEIREVYMSVFFNTRDVKDEFADCFILLYGAAAATGLTYTGICDVIADKMEINMQRKWGNSDVNGVVKHIKAGETPSFEDNIEKLSELYEKGKDLVMHLVSPAADGFITADKLRGVLTEMRDMAGVFLQKANENEKNTKAI